jgi:hypothetical protein
VGKSIFAALVVGGCLAATTPVSALHAQQTSIQTMYASWGYAGERKNVQDDVMRLCEGKPSCTFMVKNETFPTGQPTDPSPGNDKGLMIGWKCGDVQHKYEFAEGRNATVDCGAAN